MKTPHITVVMPAYNAGQFMEDAIQSVINQSLTSWELLIIDDGSTDNTVITAKKFTKTDDRIRVIERAHEGIVSALNCGIENATAPLIARLDADDVAAHHRFILQHRVLSLLPEVAVVGSNVKLVDPTGVVTRRIQYPVGHRRIAKLMRSRNALAHSSVTFRRDVMMDVGGYRTNHPHVEDYDLWLRVLRAGWRFANIPFYLLNYRVHPDSVSMKNLIQQHSEALKLSLIHDSLERSGATELLSHTDWLRNHRHRAGMFAWTNRRLSRVDAEEAAAIRDCYQLLDPSVRNSPEMAWLHARGIVGSVRRKDIGGFKFWLRQGLNANSFEVLRNLIKRR